MSSFSSPPSKDCHGVPLGLGDASPNDRDGENLVGRLKDDQAVFEVLEQVEHDWIDAERVKPERKDAGFAFAFGVEIFDCAIVFGFLFVEGARPDQVLKRLATKARLRRGFPATRGEGMRYLRQPMLAVWRTCSVRWMRSLT
jgi:hypothetical protein